MERIPVAGPSITQKEIDYVTDAVTNAWYGIAEWRTEISVMSERDRSHPLIDA
jgi:hypothetical protein